MLKLEQIRKEKNITQVELADLCGVSRQSIYLVEKGKLSPSIKLAKKLSEVLKVDWRSFFMD